MVVTEIGVDKIEQELLKTSAPLANLYDPMYFTVIKHLALTDSDGNIGIFKVFTYKNSLRFSVLVRETPSAEIINWLINEIKLHVDSCGKKTILLWYSQVEGFSTELFDRLKYYDDSYRFFLLRLERDAIDTNVDMKGLTSRHCTVDMIDTCIEIMEDFFTKCRRKAPTFMYGDIRR